MKTVEISTTPLSVVTIGLLAVAANIGLVFVLAVISHYLESIGIF